jgi:nucleoside-diphosphate-sugar epimerase
MKVVTGGSGFIGLELVGQLLERGDDVTVFDRERSYALPAGARFVKGDIRDGSAVSSVCSGADAVFHLVGIMPQARAKTERLVEINVGGTRNALKACVENGVRRMVFLSSSEVYGKLKAVPCPETAILAPVGEYGRTKITCELMCREYMHDHGLGVSILRPTSVVGPRDWEEGVQRLLKQYRENGFVTIPGDGHARWQSVHVADVASAAILAAEREEAVGHAFNVACAGDIPTQLQLARHMKEFTGSEVKLVHVNSALAAGLLKFLNFFGASPMEPDHFAVAFDDYVLDVSKIEGLLGWEPRFDNLSAFEDMYLWYDSTH